MVLASTALLLLASDVANAQVGGGGSIQGTVRDTSNAPVPGATVTATNVATGIDTVRQTTAAGVYALTPLPPGEYRVTVTLDGFQRFVRDGLIVDALSVVGLNITLQVAGVKQEVVVSAASPPLATADARLGQTIRNEMYTALPLVMNTGGPRDPTAFMFLMPGVQSIGRWGNVMGGQDFTTDMYVEGDSDHERGRPGRRPKPVVRDLGGRRRSVPGRDERHRRDVQRPGRVQLRRQVRDEHVPRQRVRVLPKQGARYEGVLCDGQAVRQPARIRRPRSAARYARTRCSSSWPTTDTATAARHASTLTSIPTVAERNGDFSALPVTIYDPRTTRPNPTGTGFVRDPFPGNIIPSDRISPISRILPVIPAGADQRRPAEQLSRRGAADRLQQRQRHGESGSQAERTAATLGAVRARQAQPGDAVPRRDQPADGSAPAIHRDAPRRRSPHERASQAHVRSWSDVGESGQRRLLAALGADFQRDDRRAVSDQGGSGRAAGR